MNDKEKLEAIEKVIPKARLTTLTVGNAHKLYFQLSNRGNMKNHKRRLEKFSGYGS